MAGVEALLAPPFPLPEVKRRRKQRWLWPSASSACYPPPPCPASKLQRKDTVSSSLLFWNGMENGAVLLPVSVFCSTPWCNFRAAAWRGRGERTNEGLVRWPWRCLMGTWHLLCLFAIWGSPSHLTSWLSWPRGGAGKLCGWGRPKLKSRKKKEDYKSEEVLSFPYSATDFSQTIAKK